MTENNVPISVQLFPSTESNPDRQIQVLLLQTIDELCGPSFFRTQSTGVVHSMPIAILQQKIEKKKFYFIFHRI